MKIWNIIFCNKTEIEARKEDDDFPKNVARNRRLNRISGKLRQREEREREREREKQRDSNTRREEIEEDSLFERERESRERRENI